MIKHRTAGNFLRHVFSESAADIANITVAEAEDDYNTILQYLGSIQRTIDMWIEELKQERGGKK
jgi:hypothetical protein